MAITTPLTHTIDFSIVFSGLNDFVTDGGAYVISDNTVGYPTTQIRTIDQITRSPNSVDYLPVLPLSGTDLYFKWTDYRLAEMWTFNIWNTSSQTLFAHQLAQTIYNSIHSNISGWGEVYGLANYDGFEYPNIDEMNIYICWGFPLDTDHMNTLPDQLIFPFFYLGRDPQSTTQFSLSSMVTV